MNLDVNDYFLSLDEFKESTPIDKNVDDSILKTVVVDAQLIDIQNILGTTLYKELTALVNTDAIETVEFKDYKKLLDDFVVPTQIKFAFLRSFMPLAVAFRNKGLMENNSENSVTIDQKKLYWAESTVRNDTEYYSNKLKGYLCWFFDKYPDMKCNTPDNRKDYNQPNTKNAYFSGVYLG